MALSKTSRIPAASPESFDSPATPHRRLWPALLLLCLAIALAVMSWLYGQYRDAQQELALLATPEGQQEFAKQQVAVVVAKVSKLMVLPADEEPVVATILDVEKLAKDQPFYRGAKNGDKVLIYVKNKRALIYDEQRNLIVNVGPVQFDGAGAPTASTPNPAP